MNRKFSNVILRGQRLFIRPMLESDAEFVVNSRNDPRVHKWLFKTNILTVESHLKWFAKPKPDRMDFIICLNENNKAIGTLTYDKIDIKKNSAEIGKMLAPDYWSKGYMMEALPLWLAFGFENLCLKSIYAQTLSSNYKNIKLNQKFGFKIEKIISDKYQRDDGFYDIISMVLTKKEAVKGNII